MRLKKLKISNFRGFVGTHEVEFPDNGLVLIRGLNESTGDSSDSGKTTLLLSILYLLGDCYLPVTKLQSWYTEEKLEVEGHFDNNVVITRSKGKTKLVIDGEEVSGGSKIVEDKITEIFGLDSNLRTIATYRRQRKPGMFLSMSDPDKKSFLGTVIGLEQAEKAVEEAKQKAKELQGSIDSIQSAKAIHDLRIEEYQQELDEPDVDEPKQDLKSLKILKETIQKQLKENGEAVLGIQKRISAKVRADIEKYSEKLNKDITLDVSDLETEATKLKIKIDEIDSQYQKQLDQYNEKLREIQKIEFSNSKKESRIKQLKQTLNDLRAEAKSLKENLCPTCKRTWEEAQARFKEVVATGKELKKELESIALEDVPEVGEKPCRDTSFDKELKQVQSAIENRRSEYHSQLKNVNNLISIETKNLQSHYEKKTSTKIEEIYASNSTLEKKLSSIEVEISQFLEQKALFNSQKAKKEGRKSDLQKEIEASKAKAAQIKDLSNQINLELDFIDLAGPKGFLGYIFEDIVTEISDKTNEILESVANVSKVSLRFEMDKETKAGKVNKKITPIPSIDGNDVDIESGLSGGMQASLELAVDLAVSDVLARRSGKYPKWLILDESFDGLGPVSKESCMEMLSKFAEDKLILVVDHASEFQDLFHKTVELRNRNNSVEVV